MARPKRRADCHPDRNHHAKGYCKSCYGATEYAADPTRIDRWAQAHPEQVRLAARKARLKRQGTTPEAFAAQIVSQGGRCWICRTPLYRPEQDHAHTEPPTARGVLCHPCNVVLGMAFDDPTILRAAADYLDYWTLPRK